MLAGTGERVEVGSGAWTSVLVKAGIPALLGNATPFEDSDVCDDPGSSSDNIVVCCNGDVVSAAKLVPKGLGEGILSVGVSG
jgi:hypothetical protein